VLKTNGDMMKPLFLFLPMFLNAWRSYNYPKAFIPIW